LRADGSGCQFAFPDGHCLDGLELNLSSLPQNDMTGTMRFVLVVNVLAVSQDNPQGRAALVVSVWRSQIGTCLSSADEKSALERWNRGRSVLHDCKAETHRQVNPSELACESLMACGERSNRILADERPPRRGRRSPSGTMVGSLCRAGSLSSVAAGLLRTYANQKSS
jgi:hypothetical protein